MVTRAPRGALALAALSLAGCVTASVESRPLTVDELTAPPQGQTLEGVIYFPPRPYLLVYHFTQLDAPIARPPARAGAIDSASCLRAVQRTELQVLPDFAHPRLMVATRHGIGTARLSVSLSNGMITAVNTDGASTLSDALKAFSGSYADVLAATKAAPPPGPYVEGVRLCNASPVLSAIVPVDWTGNPITPMPESLLRSRPR